MRLRDVLLVYKKSAYQIYVLERKHPRFTGRHAAGWDVERLKRAHRAHQETLRQVEAALRASGIRYRMIFRALQHDYRPYDFVISVGGDGTFLEAARGVRRQPILGVNSDPERSAGSFCHASGETFGQLLERILAGALTMRALHRMQLRLNGRNLGLNVLNDVLIAHENPAAMSRYWIQVNGVKEEQRSSGLWIATAAGSTGAMKSAGGNVLPKGSTATQYLPRELYRPSGMRYRLMGGVIPGEQTITLRSFMRQGMVYVDGAHMKIPFRYGDQLQIKGSRYPLRVVDG